MAATPALLNNSTPSEQGQQQQHNYGSITTPHSSRIDRESGNAAGFGATPRLNRKDSTIRQSVSIVVPEQQEHQVHDDNASIVSSSSCSSGSSSCSSVEPLLHGQGGHRYPSKTGNGQEEEEDEDASSKQLFWTYALLAPVLLSIWGLFAGLLWLLPPDNDGSIVDWGRFGVGVIGWTVAFALRTPIFAFFDNALHMDEYRCEWSTLLTAGALEEVLRLGILLLLGIGTDFEAVYSLGLGWSGIETMYYIGQSLFYAWWFSDDDYRAVASVAITETITPPSTAAAVITSDNGNDSGIESSVKNVEDNVGDEVVSTKEARHLLGIDRPWWSLMGRTSSMMVHIGLCCWLGYYEWLLLIPAALVHGSLYVIWGVLMPDHWSVPATSYGTMMAAMGVFLIGLALYGEII